MNFVGRRGRRPLQMVFIIVLCRGGGYYRFIKVCGSKKGGMKASFGIQLQSAASVLHEQPFHHIMRLRERQTFYFLLVPFLRSVLRLMSHIRSSLDCLKRDIISSKVISEGGVCFLGSHTLGLLRFWFPPLS